MIRASQHLTGPLRYGLRCAAVTLAGLAIPAAAQPIVLGGSGKPAIEINRAATGTTTPDLGSGLGGGLLYPGQQPAHGQVGTLRPPGGAATAKTGEPPRPQLRRPRAPAALPARPTPAAPRPPPALASPAVPAASAPPPPPASAVSLPPPPPPPPPASVGNLPLPPPPATAAVPRPAPTPAPTTPIARAAPTPAPPAAAAPAPRATAPATPPGAPTQPLAPLAMRPSEDGPMFSLTFEPGAEQLSETAKAQIRSLAAKVKSEGGRLQLKAFASAVGGNASQARRTSLSRALAVRSHFIQEGLRSSVMDVRALGVPSDGGREDRVDVILLER